MKDSKGVLITETQLRAMTPDEKAQLIIKYKKTNGASVLPEHVWKRVKNQGDRKEVKWQNKEEWAGY